MADSGKIAGHGPYSDMPSESDFTDQQAKMEDDKGEVDDSQGKALDAYNRVKDDNKDDSVWHKFLDAVHDWLNKIAGKISDFFAKVGELWDTLTGLSEGEPYAIYGAGASYLEARSILSGQLTMMSQYNLKCLQPGNWTGDAGNVYAAGTAAQQGAVERLGTWCGDVGTAFQAHGRNVVGAYIDMRTLFAQAVRKVGNAVVELASATISGLGAVVDKLYNLASELIGIIIDLKAAFEKWGNESMRTIDRIQSGLADQKGTAGGEWPAFVAP